MSSHPLDVGQTIGDYEILSLLGRGGMGKVFKVRNLISDRIEAMKVLLPDVDATPDLAERFLREIKLVATLDHPNIAGLRTALRSGTQMLMIMEYIDGQPLDHLQPHPPDPRRRSLNHSSARRPKLRSPARSHSPRRQALQHSYAP
ncbi:MAG: protein kinase [Candidatus Sulfotelmatobacter sp.]